MIPLDNDDAERRHGVEPTYKKKKGFQPLQMNWGRYFVDAVFRGGDKHSNYGDTVQKMIRHMVNMASLLAMAPINNNSVYYNDCCSNKFGGIGLFNAGDRSGSITNNYVTDNYCGKSSAWYYFSQAVTSTFVRGRGIYLTATDVYSNVIRWNIVSTGNRWYSIEQRPNVGSNTIYSNY